MGHLYICLIVLAIILAVLLLICLCIHLRKRWACKKVKCLSCEQKKKDLNKALAPFGFRYEQNGDLISSTMYPWQRDMGFCWAYDEAAPVMYMIIDCEPIYFNYEGKRWLLELWKGQYGCTTGAEIGLYVNTEAHMYEDPKKLFYDCVEDEERLQMKYVLYKKNRVLIKRREKQWWLTGFQVGEYSRKEDLTMEVTITFPTSAMRRAVYDSLVKMGYPPCAIQMDECRICFMFGKPYTPQPNRYCKLYIWYVCKINKMNCKLYCRVTRCFSWTLDKISFLGYCFPVLYRLIIRLGTKCNLKKLKKYKRRL